MASVVRLFTQFRKGFIKLHLTAPVFLALFFNHLHSLTEGGIFTLPASFDWLIFL